MKDVKAIEALVSDWEETVRWIARGWDDIEEYLNDVAARETLAEALDEWPAEHVPEALRTRIAAADEAFLGATEQSRLCVWHVGPQFRSFENGWVELTFEHYDPDTYWYFYRWQPDCLYAGCEHDGISYQREKYGMDFENMSEEELKEAARQEVARWHEMHGLPSPWED